MNGTDPRLCFPAFVVPDNGEVLEVQLESLIS